MFIKISGLSWTNVNKKVHWKFDHEGVLQDEDGSLTGSAPGSKLVPLSGIVNSSDCTVG